MSVICPRRADGCQRASKIATPGCSRSDGYLPSGRPRWPWRCDAWRAVVVVRPGDRLVGSRPTGEGRLVSPATTPCSFTANQVPRRVCLAHRAPSDCSLEGHRMKLLVGRNVRPDLAPRREDTRVRLARRKRRGTSWRCVTVANELARGAEDEK